MLRRNSDPDGAEESHLIYEVGTPEGAPRSTKKLAIAALEAQNVAGRYAHIEWPVVRAFGTVLSLLMNVNMPNYHEFETPKVGFSMFSCQLNEAYEQLLYDTGPVERIFQNLFRGQYGRDASSLTDICNTNRRHDAAFIVGVVRKFCPWPDVSDNFEHYVNRAENLLLDSFQAFFRRDFLPRMAGRVLLPGPKYGKKDGTNHGRLIIQLSGTKVTFTFWPSYTWRSGRIAFAVDFGDRSGSCVIEKCTLPAWRAQRILDSFLWRTGGEVVTLDARQRALGEQGFVLVRNVGSKDPILADKALVAA